MRIIVTGSRDWPDWKAVYRTLNALCEEFDLNLPPDEHSNTMPDRSKITIVHGACPTGADFMADQWCIGALLEAEQHPADWDRHGRSAGPKRNQTMADLGADLCIAFPLRQSRGTVDMITKARAAGIAVRIHNLEESNA